MTDEERPAGDRDSSFGAEATRPDVLFVVLDSVRPDRLATYGHHRSTTPALDRLAQESLVFDHALTQAPWTLPAHCSMFTGLYPSEHGVTTWFADDPGHLSPTVETLADRLGELGYRSAAFSNNPWVGQLTGLDRGFDTFVEWDLEISRSASSAVHTRGDRLRSRCHSLLGTANRQPLFLLKRRYFTDALVSQARRWLEDAAETDAPTFTFLNLMEAHSPYFPPRQAFRDLDLSPPGPIEPRLLNTRLLAYVLGKASLSQQRRERVLEFYDASLRYQDRKLATLFEVLRDQDQLDDTLVIICSDHGKNVGEIDRSATPPHYTQSINTDVPLIINVPGQHAGQRVHEPVELTGLFDLILEGRDAPVSVMHRDGHALVEYTGPHTGRSASDTDHWRVIDDGEYRYIRGDDGQEFMFRDGDRVTETGAMRTWLRKVLDERVESMEAPQSVDSEATHLSSSVEGQLRDLGYLE